MPNISSPSDGIITYDDTDCNPTYIDLPEDFEFVESAAYNAEFNADKFYIPVQLTGGRTWIYEADLNDGKSTLVCGPIKLKESKWSDEQKLQLTAFGSDLDKNGRLWLCIFNRNLLVAVDLNTKSDTVTHEVEIFAPNDVCVDRNNTNIIYAVAGKKRYLFTDPSAGKVKKVEISDDPKIAAKVSKISRGKNTLAGIEATHEGEIIVAQLFDMFRLSPRKKNSPLPFWREERFWHANDGTGKMWLADNISSLGTDGKTFMAPAYNTCSSSIGNVILKSRSVTSLGNFTAQVVSAVKNKEATREALENPEVDVAFSNNDCPDPLRFIKMSNFRKGFPPTVEHYEVHLKDAHARTEGIRPGRKFFFDTNVTAVQSFKDKLICINFQQPRLLVLDLDKFYDEKKQRELLAEQMKESLKWEKLGADRDDEEELAMSQSKCNFFW